MQAAILSNRRRVAPLGLAGGLPGACGRMAQPWAGGTGPFLEKRGARALINLRGRNDDLSWWKKETGATSARGIAHLDAMLDSRKLPTREMLVRHMQIVRKEHGTSILWATHLVQELEHADRIILMVAGQIVSIGSPAELMNSTKTSTLNDAYFVLTGADPEPATAA